MTERRRPPHGALPAAPLLDPQFKLLHYRVLHFISLHDRMSIVTGRGAGCTTGRERMLGILGCDNTSLSKALTYLEAKGYISVERVERDRRLKTYRVQYPGWESWLRGQDDRLESWRSDQQKSLGLVPPFVGSAANYPARKLAQDRKQVGLAPPKNRTNPGKTAPQYDREDDSAEAVEHYSVETDRLAPVEAAGNGVGGEGSDIPHAPEKPSREVAARLLSLERTIRRAPDSFDFEGALAWLSQIQGIDVSFGTPEFRRLEDLKATVRDRLEERRG